MDVLDVTFIENKNTVFSSKQSVILRVLLDFILQGGEEIKETHLRNETKSVSLKIYEDARLKRYGPVLNRACSHSDLYVRIEILW